MIPVETQWLPRDEAEAKYGFRLYQGGAVPGKEIRVVKAGEWEVEACAGTHVKNTGEIGFIKILHTERIQDGIERIVYSTAHHAVEASQDKEKLLRQVAETLNAPIDKLLPTAKRLLKEWKEIRRENKRLIEELAALESGKRINQTAITKEIDGIKLMIQKYEPINVNRMIKTASKLTKKDPASIALFYGVDKKTARLVILAGSLAVAKGIDASEIAQEAAKILGGGGSGRPEFAQGGGTRSGRISIALQKAEAGLRKQLSRAP